MTIKKLHTANKIGFATLLFFSAFFIPQIYADLSVGDPYEGGTVFCVSQTPDIKSCVTQGSGKYGLIMANEDQVNFDSNAKHGVTWASEYKKTGAFSDDDGAANTAAIIAAHPQDNPSNNAAWLCSSYRGGGKEGWYLPSKNELNKMYLFAKANNLIGRDCAGRKAGGIQCLIGGYVEDAQVYWSSTECSGNSNYAWAQYFDDGLQNYYNKDLNWFGARAVRAFINLSIQPFNNLPKLKSPQAVGLAVPAVSPQAAVSAAALAAAPVQKPTAQVHTPQAAAATVPVAPSAAAAASTTDAPAHAGGAGRFTFGDTGERLARLGDLPRLYPPGYLPPTLVQALTEAGVPDPELVNGACDDTAACAIADGAVSCTKLTKEDAADIAMYTYECGDNSPYRLINLALFKRDTTQLRKLRGLIYRLLHALRNVEPVRPQTLFRGIRQRVNLNATHYHRGNKVMWHSFSSTTTDMEVTKFFLTDQDTQKCEGTLFIIRGTPWGYKIKPFSCTPGEDEILLEPEVELMVTGVIDPPTGLTVIDLEMLPNQRLLLENLIPRNIGAVVSGSPSIVSPVAASPVQYKEYTAQSDWQSTIAGGLSFKRGDVIKIIDDKNTWWMGELNGQRGWVPPSYLKPEHSM